MTLSVTNTAGNQSLVEDVVAAVRDVAGREEGFKPLHAPTLGGNAWDYVKECIDTGWVSSAGAYVTRFEEAMAAFTGAKRAVAVVNGTAALHIALMLAGVRPGDEVIMPSLTFVATANAVSYCGATPHFVDVEYDTLGLDAAKLREHLTAVAKKDDGGWVNGQTGRPLRVVVPMHTFGHPVNVDALTAVCDDFGLVMVEDAAESLGSYYKDRHTGTFGKFGILSFNGNKTITTGGGGMILTDDEALAARAKHLTTTAKQPHAWEYVHDAVGYNYRMPNINAALGCAQLEQLPDLLARKGRLAARYRKRFAAVDGVSVADGPADCRVNNWLIALVLAPEHAALRDATLQALNDAGYQSRPIWMPMHELPMYKNCPRMDLGVTEDLARRVINPPSSADLEPA